ASTAALLAGSNASEALGAGIEAGRSLIQGAVSAIGSVFATSQAGNIDKTHAQLQQAILHLGGVANMDNNGDQDPRKRGDWLRHAQKAINNARKFAERVRGKTGEALRDVVRRAQELHDHLANP
ncbi:MAG: hypothetical protein WBM00_12595, partial [Solirubrobacterales bacterium]